MKKLTPIYALLTASIILMSISCNSSDDDSEGEPITVSSNTLVTAFSLAENDKVIADLDSLHFTIDVANRLIYNADSLPKDTKINRLVAKITYSSAARGEITISGAETMNDTTYTYTSSESDSIDFTGNVYFTVSAPDGISSKRYQIKVNVHEIESDSLYWNRIERRNLPSFTNSGLQRQKTVQKGETLYCLIIENGTYTLSSNDNPATTDWDKNSVTFGFNPDIDTFTATDNALYILSDDKILYTSADGISWNNTGKSYENIIGNYDDKLLCLVKDGADYFCELFANGTASGKTPLESDFPISDFSQCVTYKNDWSLEHQVFIMGGRDAEGRISGNVWGFDGTVWGKISRIPIPARYGVTLVKYFYFSGSYYNPKRYPAWLAIGGCDNEGNATKNVYISYDNGVTWKLGDELLQLPDYIYEFSNAQAFVYDTTYEVTRSSATVWESYPSRKLPFWWVIAGTENLTRASTSVTSWDCPYIYLFGGYDSNGVLLNNIWKGVVNRLTFKPVI